MANSNTIETSSEQQPQLTSKSPEPQRSTTPPLAHLKSPTTKTSDSTTNPTKPQVSQSQRPHATSFWQPPSSIIGNPSGFVQQADNAPSKDGLWSPSQNKVKVPEGLKEAAEREMEVRRRYHEDEEELVKKQ